MKKISVWITVCALILSLTGCTKTEKSDKDKSDSDVKKAEFVKDESVSFDISPSEDFYGYVNANSLWDMDIKYGESNFGSLSMCNDLVLENKKDLLKRLIGSSEKFDKESPGQLIRDYYYQCSEKKQDMTAEFDRVFEYIDSVKTPDDVISMSGKLLSEYGINVLCSFSVVQNFYSNNEYIVSFDSVDIIDDFETFMKNDTGKTGFRDKLRSYLTGFGTEYDEAEKRADSIVLFLTECGKNTDMETLEYRITENMVNLYSAGEMKELFGNIDLKKCLSSYGIENYPYEKFNLCFPGQLKVINSYLTSENIQMWKDIAKFRFITEYEDFAPQSYLFYEKTDENLPEDDIMEIVLSVMAEPVSALYKEEYYTEKYEKEMSKLESDLKEAYVKMIRDTEWLSDDGKEKLVKKFENISFFFGGQEKYDFKDSSLIGKNAFFTKKNIAVRSYKNMIKKIGTVPDNSEWDMYSHEVNAYYEPSANSVYVPCGIMNAPFYESGRNYYENLGGLGSVICHELSHAFDPDSIKLNYEGKYDPEWINEKDREAFEKLQQKAVDFYDTRTLMDVYYINGRKTINENFADLGGVQCVLSMADTKEDTKLICESYAKIWSDLILNTKVIDDISKDVHSPSLVRVNSVLMNMEEFYDAYDIKEGDGMYLPPEKRVKRW